MIEEKYKSIAPLIERAKDNIPKHRKMFTQRLENRPNDLEAWIKYLCEVDIVQAAIATTELNGSNTYYQMLVNEAIENNVNISKKILSLLYLDNEKEIIKTLNLIKVPTDKVNDENEEYEEYDDEYTEESYIKEAKNDIDLLHAKNFDKYYLSEEVTEINKNIIKHLIEGSNYQIILDYLRILTMTNHEASIINIFELINKTVLNNKNINTVQTIINNLLEKKQYLIAIQLLDEFGVDDYQSYTKISNDEYRELIRKNYQSINSYSYQEKLFRKNGKSLYEWFKEIKDAPTNNEHAYYLLDVILRLLIERQEFETEYRIYINKINNHINFYNLYSIIPSLINDFTKFYNLVIEKEPEKIFDAINLFDISSPYCYNPVQKSIIYIKVKDRVSTYNETMRVINNITDNENFSIEDKIYIYMNTHLKLLINLSDYLKMIIKDAKYSNKKYPVKDYFKDYLFYLRILRIENKTKKLRSKFINICENNKVRGSKLAIERIYGCQINNKYVLKGRIVSFAPFDNSFEIEYIKTYDNSYLKKRNHYEDVYNNLSLGNPITDEDIKNIPGPHDINYESNDEMKRFFKMQYSALENIKNNYKDFIRVLEKDKVNFFRWPQNGTEAIQTHRTETIEARIKNFFKKDDMQTKFYDALISLVSETDATLEEIIFIYMNTALKFNLSINDLMRILIYNDKLPENEVIDLSEIFNDYVIYGKIVNNEDENYNILHTHQLWTFKITTDKKDFLDKKRYVKFKLKEFDTINNRFTTHKLKLSHHYLFDHSLAYINYLLNSIKNNGYNNEIREKLEKAAPVEVLKEDIMITSNSDMDPMTNYVFLLNRIFIKYINKEENKLFDFLKAIENNNLFIYPHKINTKSAENILTLSGFSFSIDKFKETFANTKKLYMLVYLYLNSHYRAFINFDTLLQNYCINHNIINQELDLTDIRYTLEYNYITDLYNTEPHWDIEGIKHDFKLIINDDFDENYKYTLKMIKYHSGTNELHLKVIGKELKKRN